MQLHERNVWQRTKAKTEELLLAHRSRGLIARRGGLSSWLKQILRNYQLLDDDTNCRYQPPVDNYSTACFRARN